MRILGLNLGASTTSFALWDNGKVSIISIDGSTLVPSVLMHDQEGQILVGAQALAQSELTSQGCYQSLLRFLGLYKSELNNSFQAKHSINALKEAPIQHTKSIIKASPNLLSIRMDNPEIWLDDGYHTYAPAFLIAQLLLRLYRAAEAKVPSVTIDSEQDSSTQNSNLANTGILQGAGAEIMSNQGSIDLAQGSIDSKQKATKSAQDLLEPTQGAGAVNSFDLEWPHGQAVGKEDIRLIITCPGYFNVQQRQLLKEAAALAQLPCEVISASTAELLYFAHKMFGKLGDNQTSINSCFVMLFDWSASRFECTLVGMQYTYAGMSLQQLVERNIDVDLSLAGSALDNGGKGIIEIRSLRSEPSLGGDELTWAIVDLLVQNFQYKYQIDLYESKDAVLRLFKAAEKARIELSSKLATEILVPYIYKYKTVDLHLEQTLTREQIQSLYKSFIRKCFEECLKCLQHERIDFSQISQIFLTGGVTQWPLLQEELEGLLRAQGQGSSRMENDFFRSFERRERAEGFVPKMLKLDKYQEGTAVGAALYGALDFGLNFKVDEAAIRQLSGASEQARALHLLASRFNSDAGIFMLAECSLYAWSIGTSASNAQDIIPQYTPLPVAITRLLNVHVWSKDPLTGKCSLPMYFKRENQSEPNVPQRATVTVFLRQGRHVIAELTLPHVLLIASEAQPRRIGSFFINEPEIVAQVELRLSIIGHDRVVVTLSDVNDPSNFYTWYLPERGLGAVEFRRMQQELWLDSMIEQQQQKLQHLTKLNTQELLAYLDAHPDVQNLLQRQGMPTQATPLSTAQDSDHLAEEQVLAAARNLANKVNQADPSVDFAVLGQVVDQAFAQKLTSAFAQAQLHLNNYHECNKSLTELKDLLGKALTELQRVRTASEQEVTRTKKFAIEGILKDVLPVFDALDQAVTFVKEHQADDSIVQGQVQILDLFTNILKQHQVQVVDPLGQPFDPQFHQAIGLFKTSELKPNTVAKTLQKAFILNGRVVRAAQVLVSAPVDKQS